MSQMLWQAGMLNNFQLSMIQFRTMKLNMIQIHTIQYSFIQFSMLWFIKEPS